MTDTFENMGEIYVIGPQPPPYHGAAKNTRRIAEQFARNGWTVTSLNTAPEDSRLRGFRYHISRARRFLHSLMLLRAPRTVYIVPDGGFGIIYTLLFCARLRISGARVVLHHRNYSHINLRSRAMAAIVRQIAPDALHVFLDATMGRRFCERYDVSVEHLVLSNAALNDIASSDFPGDVVQRANSIGYLSAVSVEKGFDTAAKAFGLVAEADPCAVFHVAGAVASTIEEVIIASLQARYPNRVVYWGEINGEKKQQFFGTVGVFVFPSRYKKEAQPNVIFEAMASGCYVISSRIACIPEMLSGVPSALISDGPNGSEELAAAITQARRSYGTTAHKQIVDAYRAKREVALRELDLLLKAIGRWSASA